MIAPFAYILFFPPLSKLLRGRWVFWFLLLKVLTYISDENEC